MQAAHIFYKIFRGQPMSQLGWDRQPPRLRPEFWGSSRASGTILRVQVRPESMQLLWEPDPGQMDVEVNQEATIRLCFERHLSHLPLAENMACSWPDSVSTSLIHTPRPRFTHTHTSHPFPLSDSGPQDPRNASLPQGANEALRLRHMALPFQIFSFLMFLCLCLSL